MTVFEEKQLQTITIHFIVGAWRSGTTLLTQIFNANSEVLAVPETIAFLRYRIYKKKCHIESMAQDIENYHKWRHSFNKKNMPWQYNGKPLVAYLRNFKPSYSYANFLKAFYLCFQIRSRTDNNCHIKTIIDKEPKNSFYIKEIHSVFLGAKFILLIRDYRAVLNSHKKSPDSLYHPVKHALRWRSIYQNIEQFAAQYPDKIVRVQYEKLVAGPEPIIQELCNQLSIGYTPQMLKYHEQEALAEVNTSGEMSIRDRTKWEALKKPVNTSRLDKWHTELSADEIIIADLICGKLGAKYGYMPLQKFSHLQKIKTLLKYTPAILLFLPIYFFPRVILKKELLFRWFLKFKTRKMALD